MSANRQPFFPSENRGIESSQAAPPIEAMSDANAAAYLRPGAAPPCAAAEFADEYLAGLHTDDRVAGFQERFTWVPNTWVGDVTMENGQEFRITIEPRPVRHPVNYKEN